MYDDFRIRVGIEAMSASLEFAAKIREVVDLSVKDDPYGLILVVNRLMTTRNVDDAQPAHAEPDRPLRENAFVIWAAMHDLLAHAVDVRVVSCFVGPHDQARYSAHGSISSVSGAGIARTSAAGGPCKAMGCSTHKLMPWRPQSWKQ